MGPVRLDGAGGIELLGAARAASCKRRKRGLHPALQNGVGLVSNT